MPTVRAARQHCQSPADRRRPEPESPPRSPAVHDRNRSASTEIRPQASSRDRHTSTRQSHDTPIATDGPPRRVLGERASPCGTESSCAVGSHASTTRKDRAALHHGRTSSYQQDGSNEREEPHPERVACLSPRSRRTPRCQRGKVRHLKHAPKLAPTRSSHGPCSCH